MAIRRDARGRFAGGGGGSSSKPKPPGWSPAMKAARSASPPPTGNKVAPSPRQLNPAEKAYMAIKSQRSKFRSDAKVRAEMQRQGFLKGAKDPQDALMRIARSARKKKGSPY